jgi:ribosomal protein S18 acetylase RimI-like enzyme
MKTFLRPATVNDGPAVVAVQQSAIRELCVGDYSAEQLASWSSSVASDTFQPSIPSHLFIVAEGANGIVGFADFDDSGGELLSIYVHSEHARLGLGSMLLQAIESRARAAGVQEMVLNSSLTAVPFFERVGFVAAPPTTRRLPDGTEIPVVPMRRAF